MSLFCTTSVTALLAGVVQIVTLNSEDFSGSPASWSWNTPGFDEPGTAFSQTTGATPTGSTGPNGGANPITRAVEADNSYCHVEASGQDGPFTIESPEFDASRGLHTLTIDIHMRFGSSGLIDDGTMELRGWNGSAWITLSNTIVGSQQTSADAPWRSSTEFGVYDSTGFSNPDFKFGIRCTKGASEFDANYDFGLDNARITGPGLAPATTPPTGTARAIALLLANRVIYVATDGDDANSGLVESLPKRTIQNAASSANRGDAVVIEDGRYDEAVTLSNTGATVAEPILIAARNPGQVTISNLRADALEGTANWIDRGGGVYGLAASDRSFLGYEVASGNFIPGYRSNSDILASSIDTSFGPNVQAATTNKPQYGMSFGSGEVRLRLRDGSDPTGQAIAITDGIRQTQLDINNSPNTIIDGIIFDGAGDTFAVNIDLSSDNCVLTNCKFFTCQFGVNPGNNCLIDNCEYSQIGVTQFRQDINDEPGNGDGSTAIFRWGKNHYVGDLVGSNEFDALIEGGIDGGAFNATPAQNVRVTHSWIHDAFEGSKIGRSQNVEFDNNRVDDISDDGVEVDTASTSGFTVGGTAEVHDNRFTNCQVAVSTQTTIFDDLFVYRNVVEVTDQSITRMPFVFKTSRTSATANIRIYHNTIRHISANGETTEGFSQHTLFFPFAAGGINGGERVQLVQNNLFIFEDLDEGDNQPASSVVSDNILANDDEAFWRSNGGSFVGDESALLIDGNFVPASGSPLENAGGTLPAGLPDSRSEQTTVGAHEIGAVIDADWPRPAAEFFRDTSPPRWTSPGA